MLLQLNIQNFAIVRSLDIDWRKGMTTITGETGAGKSIAIDALGLCLGDRALNNVVRPNTKKAELAATFDIKKNISAQKWLKNNDLSLTDEHDPEQDYECILRRVISAEGRSKAYINGSQVPLTQLKDIAQFLISIHGQHDHQLIVKPAQQRKILDEYADHQHLLDDVQYYYQQWRNLKTELKKLQESKEQRQAKLQLLQYQVNELDEFSLQMEEFETLESDYKRHSNGQTLLSGVLESLQVLSENEDFNITDSLRTHCEQLNDLAHMDPSLADIAKTLAEALIQIEDANDELKHYYDRLELDPEAYQMIEDRYSQAIKLGKKHQVAPEYIPTLHMEIKQALNLINSDGSRLDTAYIDIEKAKAHYLQSAKTLSTSRVKSAKIMSKKITLSMKELNMNNGVFEVSVNQIEVEALSPFGLDEINFLISLNPGQKIEAMNKVASGGELSRISLAMQVILADKVITPTLIFDEVDVGISGPTAAMVGSKLQELAKNTQVICVTHLPQVASKGHQQLFVSKLTDGEFTETKVTELSENGRVQEIARLLAGNKITDNSLANAQELLAG
ncbi:MULTISPECIES: DNA repair protein RecN [unclassified Colwellia]|uniref:DNA repair protein RecN n=1 Tax=unclassified Colwellia TaxID=196834 RepID=UPI0015F62921|nr:MULTISPECIES: DNA repair protein RecN [unclassified Colwellia]MBA6231792.1 DNA repair protein RecN [Colwellia sp. MB02u-7]MBA6235747.1 DNA repair protein RecN [Colwellia sp. MB02u-11]MBA6255024.1 DNA repair protein RecN [Colwellia sp. MB3u-28]MBA6259025.1 DNA repair protein RecN [Colwellia sp. MB3u-41]MBA6298836.1 DNA repair protein RecN [Colwellia sp. MB3u-22]